MDLAQHIKALRSDGRVIDVVVLKDKASDDYRVLVTEFAFPADTRFASASDAFKSALKGSFGCVGPTVTISELKTFPVAEFLDQPTVEALLAEAMAEWAASRNPV